VVTAVQQQPKVRYLGTQQLPVRLTLQSGKTQGVRHLRLHQLAGTVLQQLAHQQQQVQRQEVVALPQGSEAGAALTAVQQLQILSLGTHQQRVRLTLQGTSQQALTRLPETAPLQHLRPLQQE
jgi:hypothetical protein